MPNLVCFGHIDQSISTMPALSAVAGRCDCPAVESPALEVGVETTPYEGKIPQNETGSYAVPAVHLTNCDAFLWLPTEGRYGMYDEEHSPLMMLRPDITWSDIMADVETYFNAMNTGGGPDYDFAEYLCPWPRYPFVRVESVSVHFSDDTASTEAIIEALEPIRSKILGAKTDGQAIGIAMKHLEDMSPKAAGRDVAEIVKQIRSSK